MKILKNIAENGSIFLAYFFLALVFTWPLVFHLWDRAVGTGDANYVLWQNWWFKKAIFELHQSPLVWNNFLFYPDGYKLGNGFDGLIFPLFSLAFPLNFPAILLYNLTVLFSFTLNGFCAFLLARQLTKNSWASFLGGLAFGFSPYLLARGFAGHANLLSAWTIPLFLIFFLRLEKKTSLKNIILAALGLTLVALSSWQYLFITLFLLLALIFFRAKYERERITAKPFLAFFLLSALLIFPFALPMINGILNHETTQPIWSEYLVGSANLVTYFIPPPMATLGGFFGQKVYPFIPRFNDPEAVVFPGYFEIGLLGYFLYRQKRKKEIPKELKVWLFLAVVFFILSLGPVLTVLNQPLVILPYLALLPVPFLNLIRVPARFTIVFSLSLSLIISFWLKEKIQLGGKRLPVFVLGVFLILLIERGFWPFRLTEETKSKFYQDLRLDHRDYALANLPLWDANLNAPASYAQSLHEKKIVGGYVAPRAVSQKAMKFILAHPLFSLSNCHEFSDANIQRITESEPLPEILKTFKENNIRFLVLHKKILARDNCRQFKDFINAYLHPLSPYFEDEEIRVYKTE